MQDLDIYQTTTDQILEAMETSTGKGRRLWESQASLPLNLATGKPYSGMNVLILWAAGLRRAYTSPYWITFKQAADAGGQVRRGEHGQRCIFYKTWTAEKQNVETGEAETVKGAVLKSFVVFNLDQIDGIERPKTTERPAFEILAEAERLLQLAPAPVKEGGPMACYIPSRDEIRLPPRETFVDREAFYSTAYHEMTHSTGHKDRLARSLGTRFGSDAYAMEELIAELGAAFLCAGIGILPATRADHADYLKSWIKVLKEDKRAIFTASAAASKAAAYILARDQTQTEAA